MAQDSRKDCSFKIRFERTGGFAGVPFVLNIDSESLVAQQVEELRRLITDSDFFNLAPINMNTPVIPDAFIFIITIETGNRRHTVRVNEQKIPSQLNPLIKYLTGIARKLRGSSTAKDS